MSTVARSTRANVALEARRAKLARRLRECPFHPPFMERELWRHHRGQRAARDGWEFDSRLLAEAVAAIRARTWPVVVVIPALDVTREAV